MMMDASLCHFMVIVCRVVIVRHCVVLSLSTITSHHPLACVSAIERDMGGVVVIVAAVDDNNGVLCHW
jgi:hypothetical protein